MENRFPARQVIRDELPPVSLRPALDEIIRTGICPAGLILLVDRIHVVPILISGESHEAYRMWLSDGSKIIQGLLKPELHPFVKSKEIQAGAYIQIDKCELAHGKKLNGDGTVYYLQIHDIESVGSDGRSPVPLEVDTIVQTINPKKRRREHSPSPKSQQEPFDASTDKPPSTTESLNPSPRSSKRATPNLGSQDASDESLALSNSTPERQLTPPAAHSKEFVNNTTAPKARAAQDAAVTPTKAQTSTPMKGSPRPTQNTPLREIDAPLKITLLSKLVGAQVPRNRVHDVLAVVWSVSPDVKQRRGMPDQRDLRIIDPSTLKRVQLTVFVDAQHFTPEVGTVAVFRNVTTHEWDGGSLKAYPRDCAGKRWFIPNPQDVEGHDVQELRTIFLKRWAVEVETAEGSNK